MLKSKKYIFIPWHLAIVSKVLPFKNTVAGFVCGCRRCKPSSRAADLHMIATQLSFEDQSATSISASWFNQTFKRCKALAEA